MALIRRSWIVFLSLALQGVAFAQLHEVGDGSFGPVKAAHVSADQVATPMSRWSCSWSQGGMSIG